MLGARQDGPEPDWCVLAEAPAMTLVLAMEPGLRCPVSSGRDEDREASALRVLDALAHVQVRLVVLSDQPRTVVDGFRTTVPRAFWAAESGRWLYDGSWNLRDRGCSLASWIEVHVGRGPVMAIGDGLPNPHLQSLGAFEVGVVNSFHQGELGMARKQLPGPSAVRALLWWLVQERDRCLRAGGLPARGRPDPMRLRGFA